MSETEWRVPLVVRGTVIEEWSAEFIAARGNARFLTPDCACHLDKLTTSPDTMAELATVRFVDVVDYLDDLGRRLALAENVHMQRAYAMSCAASSLSDTILLKSYQELPALFRREAVIDRAKSLLDLSCLERWVDLPVSHGARTQARVRAFGARTMHIIAGNVPTFGALSILHNALTRGDAIIKSPANDPMTASAIARTMIDMAPHHPLTRHVTAAYWKGGDPTVERALFQPRKIEKIVAWGGVASIRHITRELPPGIDLITLDPKHSMAIIDGAGLSETDVLYEAANLLARDIGSLNQEACFNPRLVFVAGRGAKAPVAEAVRLGELTFRCLMALPQELSSPHRAFDPELRAELQALALVRAEDYRMFAGDHDEGAIIVSLDGRPVDFADRLACRVANLVPVAGLDAAVSPVGPGTQTVSVYPQSLKSTVRDQLAARGAQRIVTLGGAMIDPFLPTPHDGMELLRRMCKWIVEEVPL